MYYISQIFFVISMTYCGIKLIQLKIDLEEGLKRDAKNNYEINKQLEEIKLKLDKIKEN